MIGICGRWKTNYDLNYSCKFLLRYLASYTFLYAVNTRKSNEQKLRLKAVFFQKKVSSYLNTVNKKRETGINAGKQAKAASQAKFRL